MGKAYKSKQKTQMSKNILTLVNIIMIIAFINTIPLAITTFMTSWRVGDPIEYKYMFRGSQHLLFVDYTFYGLYKVFFDHHHSETWTQRLSNMKSKGNEGIQIGNNSEKSGSLSLLTSVCPEACRQAIVARIEAYERVSFISLILLCSIILSSTIILLSIGWNIILSKSITVLMACLVLSFIINAGVGTYWYYETDLSWNLVSNIQQYPFPKCSYCFFIFMGTTVIYAICFISLLILDLVNKRSQKKSHINQLNVHNMDQTHAKGMYEPIFDHSHNMMMQRSASYNNLIPFNKSMNNQFSNFMEYNKMGMNPMNSFSKSRNIPLGMSPSMPQLMSPNMNPNMNPNINPSMSLNMMHGMNSNFFPQQPRQHSYSGVPFQNRFDQFPTKNMEMRSNFNFPNQFSGMGYGSMNIPFNLQNQFKF